jgi:hypothetical protein
MLSFLDQVFYAIQEIKLKEQQLTSLLATIEGCEDELGKLMAIRDLESRWNLFSASGVTHRATYLLSKLEETENSRKQVERDIVKLKQLLGKDMSNELLRGQRK